MNTRPKRYEVGHEIDTLMSPTMEPLLSPTGEPTISAAAVMTTQNKESVPKLRVPAGSMTIKDLSDDAGPRMHN